MTFEIEGLMEHPRWYDVECTCDHSHIDTEFPIVDCKHCKFQAQEDSMPRESFDVVLPILDDEGNLTGDTETKTCLLYTSPSPRDRTRSRMPSSA